jgi:hypothetical protein
LNTTEEEFIRSNGHSGRLAHQLYLDLKLNKKWKEATLKKIGEICFVEGITAEESELAKHIVPVDNSTPISPKIISDLFAQFTPLKPEQQKEIHLSLAFISNDSTIVYYRLQPHLVPPRE